MILTPEQIEALRHAYYGETETALLLKQTVHTLAAYAEIVEAVAEQPMSHSSDREAWLYCPFCDSSSLDFDADYGPYEPAPLLHAPDCPYIAARRLRGKE